MIDYHLFGDMAKIHVTNTRTCPKFVLRLPEGPLHDTISAMAAANNRSANSEYLQAAWWWVDRRSVMEQQLQGIQRELLRLQAMSDADIDLTLNEIVQRYPGTGPLVQRLKTVISAG